MKINKNVVSILKGFVTPPDCGMDNRVEVASIQVNLMKYGYMLSEDAFFAMAKADIAWLQQFNAEVIEFVKDSMGGRLKYQPFYKNFPEEVMALSEYDLVINLMIHYWTGGQWMPSGPVKDKGFFPEKINHKMLEYADDVKFMGIFKTLVGMNQSLPPQDREIIEWFVKNVKPLELPSVVPFKETLCLLAAMRVEDLPVKTPTDVLRIAVFMSGGDPMLPKVPRAYKKSRWGGNSANPEREKFKFKKFKRAERKYLLSLLEQTNCNTGEMSLKDQRWIRLGEILHPGEYKNLYPKTFSAFNAIRNEKVTSWYGELEKAFRTSLEKGINVLSQRPGEFARRIDWLIRKNPEKVGLILEAFTKAVEGSSNKVLFEVYGHFENRMRDNPNRSIMIKGARKKTKLPTLAPMSKELVELVHSKLFEGLKEKFSKLEPLGNVWIDEQLKKIPMPSNMRSLNFSLKPKMRGTRVPIGNPDKKVIRPYLHFHKDSTSITIDLSVVFVGENKHGGICDYRYQRTGDFAFHSGDSFARTGACAEYVDIVVDKAIAAGYRYALVQVHNYNNAAQLNEGNYFGVMTREAPDKNRNWVPATIEEAYEMTVVNIVNCGIIDLETMELIVVDEDAGGKGWLNVASVLNFKDVEEYVREPKFSVYDLLLMHAEARGRVVVLDTKKEINTMFKFEDFVQSYEKVGEFMGV